MTSIADEKDRLFKAIGRVVVEFQFIEYTLSEELARLLAMREPSDIHRVSAAMSFKQKVDLLCDLYPVRTSSNAIPVDIVLARKALYAAEEFRNRVVHSFWHFSGELSRWQSAKASLRGKSGLRVVIEVANPEIIERGAAALYKVRDWYLGQTIELQDAISSLKDATQNIREENA